MIVLFNVKITDVRMGYPYRRGEWMPDPERFDVFRYCLASTAELGPLTSRFVFCITLAPELAHRQSELDAYMRDLFPREKLEIIWQRCDYGRDWRRICDQYLTDPNELVWLACNDDHIFLDSDLDTVKSAIKHLNLDSDPNAVFYYSHWPEQMRMANHYHAELTQDGLLVKYPWETFDGIMILKAGRLSGYFDRDYGNAAMFKVDYLGAYHNYQAPGPVYAPTKEIVRHYEGYSHVNHEMPQHLANVVPPLFIPPGFFENNMQVRVGYHERDNNSTNFNPAAEWLYNTNPAGTDYRWHVKDIPLFWQKHIRQIDHADDYDDILMKRARDAAFLAAARVPMKCFGIDFNHTSVPPNSWFQKHLLYR